MGVVESRSKHLTTRNILEGRGDPAAYLHPSGIDRFGRAEARQSGAERAQQENRLDQVAARLLDREGCEFAIVQRPFGHHPVDTKAELFGYLGERNFGNIAIATTLVRQQPMGVLDGAFASLDGDIHVQPPFAASRVVRGIATMVSSATSTTSMPRGNSVWLILSRSNRSAGWIAACKTVTPSIPGPRNSNAEPCVRLSTCRISVVERSGYSLLPKAKRSRPGSKCASPIRAKLQIEESAITGAPV